jgi:hypothetical protein
MSFFLNYFLAVSKYLLEINSYSVLQDLFLYVFLQISKNVFI